MTKMREKKSISSSYELAVRNQFFTPRYVVQFLVDNSLGRLWVEMTRDRAALADTATMISLGPEDKLSPQEQRSPRELRVIDPACGSMHFGLYAFDLLAEIYLDAWRRGVLGDTAGDEESLRAEIPRYIIEDNLMGIDIDRRAVQIAGLTLWLRAHRWWHDHGITVDQRPRLSRVRLATAQPMPGEDEFFEEFVGGLDPPVLADIARKVREELKLAGVAGSLLKVEGTAERAIQSMREARDEYMKREAGQGGLFGEQGSDAIFRAALESLISELTRGIKKAFDHGFDHVVVATDHGFLYLPERKPGDEVTPPTGSGAVKHSRYAIGPVDPAGHLLSLETPELGYTLGNGRVVLPRSLGTFGKPGFYVHGGLSLQEALVPVMTVTRQTKTAVKKAIPVSISYKGKDTGLVRTLRPSITVAVGPQDATVTLGFDEEWANRSARIRIEITRQSDNTPAGDIAANAYLDPDTGTLVIPEGTTAPIPLRINEGIYEEVVIRAINAETDTTWGTVTLKVDILE